jgi:uncharacterized protein YjeT (DUF2065 family)
VAAVAAVATPRPRPPRRAADPPLDSDVFWAALALVLVFEGLFPLIAPRGWRNTFHTLLELKDGQLRFFGLCSILGGLLTLWLFG